jgi:hypothetical protein
MDDTGTTEGSQTGELERSLHTDSAILILARAAHITWT